MPNYRLKNGVLIDEDVGPDAFIESIEVGGEADVASKVAKPATPAVITQTYSTPASTVPNATVAAVATTAATSTTPFGYTGAAQADAIPVAINALAADVLELKKVLTKVIDELQAVLILA